MTGHPFNVLHRNPDILVCPSGDELRDIIPSAAAFGDGRPVHLFVQMYWTARGHLSSLVSARHLINSLASNVRMTVMAASPDDQRLFQQNGLQAICANHNAFLDERIFYPEPGVARTYAAFYNARFSPVKRHELAAKVDNLALASAFYGVTLADLSRVHQVCPGITFSNLTPSGDGRMLSIAEVRNLICKASCGLALSRLEGAMYASAEYLLCGRPVVSTRAYGGRHMMFHPDHVAVVEDSADEVAAAVLRFVASPPDPHAIRAKTLQLMRPHRHNFAIALSRVFESDLTKLADPNGWLPLFTHRLRGAAQDSVEPFLKAPSGAE